MNLADIEPSIITGLLGVLLTALAFYFARRKEHDDNLIQLTTMSNQLDSMSEKIDEIKEEVTKITTTSGDHEKRLHTIESGLTQLRGQVKSLAETVRKAHGLAG